MSAGWADVLNRLIHSSEKTKKKPLSRALVVKEKREPKLKKTVKKTPEFETQRRKPSIQDKEYERMLQSIATKGVVQLFNSLTELEEPEPPTKQIKKSEPTTSSTLLDKWGDLNREEEDEENAA